MIRCSGPAVPRDHHACAVHELHVHEERHVPVQAGERGLGDCRGGEWALPQRRAHHGQRGGRGQGGERVTLRVRD